MKKNWVTNIRRIEIEIWTGCNLHCPNCDRSSAQAPLNEGMTVEQISKFVNNSIDLNWDWERIVIIGGEPTLHPSLFSIIAELEKLHIRNPKIDFRIYSNGYSKRVQTVLENIPKWITIYNSSKTNTPTLFSAYNVAPIDIDFPHSLDFTKGCAITEWCGLGLSQFGFYPCGAGAAVDRVFGDSIGLKSLNEVNSLVLRKQLSKLCSRCGHFLDFDKKVDYVKYKDVKKLDSWVSLQVTSPSWLKAYKMYNKSPIKIDKY